MPDAKSKKKAAKKADKKPKPRKAAKKPAGNACCICGNEIAGYGNNPAPVKDGGRCCDRCNAEKVIPARIAALG